MATKLQYVVEARKSGDSADYKISFCTIKDAEEYVAERYALSESEADCLNKYGWIALNLALDGADICCIKTRKEYT